jgi:hypothetical protein
MDQNLAQDSVVYELGLINLAKMTWVRGIAQRPMSTEPTLKHQTGYSKNATHIMFDYNDFAAKGYKQGFDQLAAAENSMTGATKIYDKNMIRVYRIEN